LLFLQMASIQGYGKGGSVEDTFPEAGSDVVPDYDSSPSGLQSSSSTKVAPALHSDIKDPSGTLEAAHCVLLKGFWSSPLLLLGHKLKLPTALLSLRAKVCLPATGCRRFHLMLCKYRQSWSTELGERSHRRSALWSLQRCFAAWQQRQTCCHLLPSAALQLFC
jgi:hypothetical protein